MSKCADDDVTIMMRMMMIMMVIMMKKVEKNIKENILLKKQKQFNCLSFYFKHKETHFTAINLCFFSTLRHK